MSQIFNDLLDIWMRELHGDKLQGSDALRLGTFIFCASLPKTISSILSEYKEGTASVLVHVMPCVEKNVVNHDAEGSTFLDQILRNNKETLIQRIYVPKQFVFSNHANGCGALKNIMLRQFNCEMTVMVERNALRIELYHKSYKRWIIFSISGE